MKVLLTGAGAVGLYYCGRLAEAGVDVSVVARRDYEVAAKSGYRVSSIAGDFHFNPAAVLKNAAEYRDEADYVFMCAKTFAPSLELLDGAIKSPRTVIVLIQNGIGIEDEIAAAYPDNKIISTVAYIGASRPVPGEVLHQGAGILKMGSFPNGKIFPEAKRLMDVFNSNKVKCDWFDDIQFQRWDKLLWNISYNTVSVLGGGLTTRQMLKADGTGKLCEMLMLELVKVANSCGVALSENDVRKQIDYNEDFPAYKTSMLQDYEAGRRMEVEGIVGNILKIAGRNGVDVPAVTFCYHLLASLDRINQKKNR